MEEELDNGPVDSAPEESSDPWLDAVLADPKQTNVKETAKDPWLDAVLEGKPRSVDSDAAILNSTPAKRESNRNSQGRVHPNAEAISKHILDTFDLDQVRKDYEAQGEQFDPNKWKEAVTAETKRLRLRDELDKQRATPESPAHYFNKRNPFGGPVYSYIYNRDVEDARKSIGGGGATGADYALVAKAQVEDEREQAKGGVRKFVDSATYLPGLFAETAATGGLNTLGRAGASRVLGSGAETLLGRVAVGAAGVAAQVPGQPTLYAANVPKEGLVKALAQATLDMETFASVGGAMGRFLPKSVTNSVVKNAVAGGVEFPVAQQMADIISHGIGMKEGYGIVGDIADKKYGDATANLLSQMVLGAGLKAIHTYQQHGGTKDEAIKAIEAGWDAENSRRVASSTPGGVEAPTPTGATGTVASEAGSVPREGAGLRSGASEPVPGDVAANTGGVPVEANGRSDGGVRPLHPAIDDVRAALEAVGVPTKNLSPAEVIAKAEAFGLDKAVDTSPKVVSPKIGSEVETKAGHLYRAFEAPDEMLGRKRSASAGLDWYEGDPYLAEFYPTSRFSEAKSAITGSAHHPSHLVGNIDPASVKTIYYNPEFFVSGHEEGIKQDLAKIKARYPNADFFRIERIEDGKDMKSIIVPHGEYADAVKAVDTSPVVKPSLRDRVAQRGREGAMTIAPRVVDTSEARSILPPEVEHEIGTAVSAGEALHPEAHQVAASELQRGHDEGISRSRSATLESVKAKLGADFPEFVSLHERSETLSPAERQRYASLLKRGLDSKVKPDSLQGIKNKIEAEGGEAPTRQGIQQNPDKHGYVKPEAETPDLSRAELRTRDATPKDAVVDEVIDRENLRPEFVEKAKAAADAAKERLSKKIGRLSSGIDPTDIPDLAIYYAGRIVEKGYDFAMFAKDAVLQMGETVKPHLQAIWDAAHDQLKPGVIIPKGEVKREGVRDFIQRAFAPTSRGENAKVASGVFREKLADMVRGRELANASMKGAAKFMDSELAKTGKDPAARDQVFLKVTDAIEGGKIDSLPPEMRDVAQAIRDMIDQRTKAITDRGILTDTIENYMGHLWAKPGMDAEQIGRSLASRRPLAGKEGFKKQRSIPTYREGIEAGLRPIDDNPVRIALKTIEAVDKSIMAHDVRAELKNQGLRKFVKLGGESPEGWVRGTDPKDTVMTPPENDGGPVLRGHYFYPEPVARLLNNYAAPGFVGNPLYDVFRGFGNALNQFQLGFGAFHAGFVMMETPITGLEVGLRKIARGDMSGIADAAKAVVPGYSPYRYFTEGSKMLKEYYAPGSQGAEYGQLVKNLVEAGGRAKMDSLYGGQIEKLRDAFKDKSILGRTTAIGRAFLAIPELISKPVMEGLVPRIKMGAFADMARLEIEKLGPNADANARRAALGKAWDSVENRFGQLTYDNMFWNRVGKDMAMASIRSVGWNVGTLREIGGGVKDIAGLVKKGDVSSRLTYLVAMPAVAALYGSIYQYIATGEGPQDLNDAFFPRTGAKRPDGSADRMSLPSYMRAVQHLTNRVGSDPLQLPKNAYEMAKGKVNPSATMIAEMLENRDYFDKEIRNPDHSYTQQAMELAKHLVGGIETCTPRTVRNDKTKGHGVGTFLQGLVGVTPAPARVTQSADQQRAIEKKVHGSRK